MDVVDHDTDVDRGEVSDRVEDPFDRFAAKVVLTEGGDDRGRQMIGIAVSRLTGQPGVDPAWVGLVGADRLGQQRRLAESGAGHDHRQRHLEAPIDVVEQARPDELSGQGGRRCRSPAGASLQRVLVHRQAAEP